MSRSLALTDGRNHQPAFLEIAKDLRLGLLWFARPPPFPAPQTARTLAFESIPRLTMSGGTFLRDVASSR
jgi:hypothetical protein